MQRWWWRWPRPVQGTLPILPADPWILVQYLHSLADEATPTGTIEFAQRDVRRIADALADSLIEK